MENSQIKKELVIAAYDKNLEWINCIDGTIQVSIYRKGTPLLSPKEILMNKNVGRCVHTFFNHIHANYEQLADITYFVQDFPFDHWSNLYECLNSNVEEMKKNCAIYHEGYIGFDTLHWRSTQPASFVGTGNVLFSDINGQPNHPGLPLAEVWEQLFVSEMPQIFEFNPGGHFAITKQQVHKRSKLFYGKIVNLLENGYVSIKQDLDVFPYCIERMENYIFNEKYNTTL
jgi:hypothetical protein